MAWRRIHGQDRARRQLQEAYARRRLGQSLLFHGPDGVGKRTFGLELAKALLCEARGGELEACDRCPSCKQVDAETHPDLHFLRTPEDKHELPVEAMRDFCARLARKPARGGHVVGIVEDGDDINEESANSFLKTLEEPPPGTILILISTSANRQLPTIRSRCQMVGFAPLGAEEMANVLVERGVADAEKRARAIRLAGGSPGRALALVDDAIWNLRGDLLAGLCSDRPQFGRLTEIWSRFVDEAGKDNSALQRQRASIVIGFLVDALRHALRLGLGAAVAGIAPEERELLAGLARRIGPDRLVELIDRCLEADARVERRVQVILVIESVVEALVAR